MIGRYTMYLPFGEELKNYAGTANGADSLGNERYEIGQKMQLPDGRAFRFGRVGATTLVAGTLVQSSVPVPNHIGQTVVTAIPAGTAGALPVETIGATALDFELYRNGVISFESGGTAKSFYYPIATHLNYAASSALVVLNLQTGYSVNPAANTSDVFSLIMNPWRNLVINATAQTAPCVGVTNTAAVTAGTINTTGGNAKGTVMGALCWIQTAGLCDVRQDASTVVAGQPVCASATTAGDVALPSTTLFVTNPIVGQCVRVAASAAWSTVNLMIADY